MTPFASIIGQYALTLSGGIQGRLFRLSFSGELAYELAVPARWGEIVIDKLMEAGKDFGIAPYGTEALGTLRIEKGHLAGPELNGETTAGDLGLGRFPSRAKDYIGRYMASRPALNAPERATVVGLRPVDRTARIRAGANLIVADAKPSASAYQGHVTSVAFSPSLDQWIGLGLLSRGPSRIGEVVEAWDPVRNSTVPVRIELPCFIDPKGERLRA